MRQNFNLLPDNELEVRLSSSRTVLIKPIAGKPVLIFQNSVMEQTELEVHLPRTASDPITLVSDELIGEVKTSW